MRRTLSATLVLTLVATWTAAQERTRVEVEANFWEPDVTGAIQVVEQSVGDDIDLADDLGLASDAVTGLRLTFHPSRRTEVRFERLPLSFSGDSVVSRTLEFSGQVFTVSTRIASQLDLDYLRAGFAWQFLSSNDGRFRAGPLVEVKGFDGSSSLSAPDLILPVTVSETFEAAFGSAGLAVDLEATDRVQLFGEFTTAVGASEGSQTDIEVGVRVGLAGALGVQAGYRSIQIDFEDNDARVDFDADGVFFGASLRF